MTNIVTRFFKILFVLTMCIISLTSIFGSSSVFGKTIDKVGHQLNKIKEMECKRSLKKIDATHAAKKIIVHIKAIAKLNKKNSDNVPIKELLNLYVEKWNTEEIILTSLLDGNQQFMCEVTTFYMRGYVKYKDECKPLFLLFIP